MASLQFIAVWLVGLVVLQLASTAPYQPPTTAPDSGRAGLAPVLGKRFKLDHCDNLEGLLQAVSMSETMRRINQRVTNVLVLNEDDGKYTLTTEIYLLSRRGSRRHKFATVNDMFRIGQEFGVRNVDLETVKAVITQNGNILTEKRTGKTPVSIVRIFTPEQVSTTAKIGEITNNCIFKPE